MVIADEDQAVLVLMEDYARAPAWREEDGVPWAMPAHEAVSAPSAPALEL
jgi:hypothetical protein